ncbi:hypothetical protein GJ496_007033 [Pomphorhynchus laevis]|nr:hypothetical protein GJ496_007033 [Pomphorhynchus laevis]
MEFWYMVLSYGTSLFWICTTIGLFISYKMLSKMSEQYQNAYLYGKLLCKSENSILSQNSDNSWLKFQNITQFVSQLLQIRVPKQLFTSFYGLGMLCGFALLYYLMDKSVNKSNTAIALVMLLEVQCLRRFYECLFVHVHNPTSYCSISIFHLIYGLSFYPFICLTILSMRTIHSDFHNTAWLIAKVLAICLFIVMNFEQHRCHRILADARLSKPNCDYQIIHRHLFKILVAPNYVCEIFIYFSFALFALPSLRFILPALNVFTSQTISSLLTKQWYLKKFGKSFPLARSVIIPYIY